MFSNVIKTGLAAAIAASAALAVPAAAAEQGESVRVRYSDLNLSTDQGQAALQRRLERAAEEVCGVDRNSSGMALPSRQARRCYNETVRNFEREVAALAAEQQRG
ncbi:MAG: UrcA family protein [Erythrobacter sp.]|nr:UrcA family protein [Erythrobacter sp.]